MNTAYDSFTLNIYHTDDCASDSVWEIDTKSNNSFGTIFNATTDEKSCKRYFLGSYDKVYQKFYGTDWAEHDINGEFPASRVTKVLEYLRASNGELLSNDDDIFVYGISSIKNSQEVYEYLNDLSALGNNWGSDNYKSLSAKVYIKRNGQVEKVIFYPESKSTDISWGVWATNSRLMYFSNKTAFNKANYPGDYDYIRLCDEITWTFSDINNTNINYKEDLWQIL